jgi:hypothetical protein
LMDEGSLKKLGIGNTPYDWFRNGKRVVLRWWCH